MLQFLEYKQSPHTTRSPNHATTFRKLTAYIIEKYLEKKGYRTDDDAVRAEAKEKLEALDFRAFHTFVARDGSVLRSEPISYLFIESFLDHRLELGDSPGAYNDARLHLIQFLDYLGIQPNPARAIMMAAREPKERVAPLSINEVEKLIAAASRSYRDLALVGLMLRAGLRSKEVRWLTLDDYSRRQRILFLGQHRKHRQAHQVPIPDDLAAVLELYVDSVKCTSSVQRYMFPAKDGGQMSHRELAAILERLSVRAGIRRVTPHLLRHTCATLYSLSGLDTAVIARILGHASITMTQHYIHIPLDLLREDVQNSGLVEVLEKELGHEESRDRPAVSST